MHRRMHLPLALILGLATALNVAPLLAMQGQECVPDVEVGEFTFHLDCDSDFAEGLEVAAVPQAGSPDADRLYSVQFDTGDAGDEAGAYIPERLNSQAMVVKVLAGLFAFRVQGPGVIVDPQGQALEKFFASSPIGLGENPNDGGRRTYTVDGEFDCQLELHGLKLCLLDPADFTAENAQNVFVRLDPGDTVYLPANSTCFLCNTDRIDPGTGQASPTGPVPAELLIWTPATGFNGELDQAASLRAIPQNEELHAVRAWMFNPGSRCN